MTREAIIGHPHRVTGPLQADATGITEAGKREAIIPSWTIFYMIILAMVAICFTVNMRTQAEATTAIDHYEKISAEVETLRNTNAAIQKDINRLQNDPRTIEATARERLGMVRPNEVVIPTN
jgi:cell division protein FtsL